MAGLYGDIYQGAQGVFDDITFTQAVQPSGGIPSRANTQRMSVAKNDERDLMDLAMMIPMILEVACQA